MRLKIVEHFSFADLIYRNYLNKGQMYMFLSWVVVVVVGRSLPW